MKLRCMKSNNIFSQEGKEYEIAREFVGNAGASKGVSFTEIWLDKSIGLVQQIKTNDLDTGKSNYVRVF